MSASVFGVIAPHPPIMVESVGGQRALVTHASIDALHLVASALTAFKPDAIVLISPHAPARAEAFAVDDSAAMTGSLSQFGDADMRHVDGDPTLASEILAQLASAGIRATPRSSDARLRSGWLDHASIVPLTFLNPQGAYPVVVLSLSGLPPASHRALGQAVRAAGEALGRRVAFIASGDLSHRLTEDAPAGYSPDGCELDSAIRVTVEDGRLADLMTLSPALVEAGGECGLRSIITLGGFCGPDPVATRVLSYEGPWGVGYLTALVGDAAVASCESPGATPPSGHKGGQAGAYESAVVSLARQALEVFVRDGHALEHPMLDEPGLPARAGVFVSLHRNGELRGCIGTVLPTHGTLAREIAANAVEAATRDPRFPALTAGELADLEVKVDVLRAPESCTIDELDPEIYGVVVTSGWRRGLLLPDLDGVDDVTEQIAIAMSKASIRPDEPCSYQRFMVDRYT